MRTKVMVADRLSEDLVKKLNEAVKWRNWITLVARCKAEYEGRGASSSTWGDKLITIKPSHSVIIHGPKGFKPENWQPDSSVITFEASGNLLLLKSIRRRPREVLVVECTPPITVVIGIEVESGEFYMYLSEHDIRDYIARHPEVLGEDLRIITVEKPVEPGFIDLYAKDSDGNIVVIELKRARAGEDAVRQLERYLDAFRVRGVSARGMLVAPSFSQRAVEEALRRHISLVKIDLAKISQEIKRRTKPKTSLTDFI